MKQNLFARNAMLQRLRFAAQARRAAMQGAPERRAANIRQARMLLALVRDERALYAAP